MEAKIIHKKVFIFIFLFFIFTGCENYLTEKNPSEVTTDFLYTTANGLQAAVNGLYTLERNQISENECNNFALIMGDCGTDIDFNRASAQEVSRYRLDIDLTTQAAIRSWWQKWYSIIERSNSIIAFGEQAEITKTEKMSVLREAYIYRAYAYFWLVRKFDNIWLNTDPTTYKNIEGRTYGVASQNDVYALIIADLDKAIEYYGSDWTVVPGKFNQGVARLLRADVALWQNDYLTAATQSTKIINEGPFALVAPENIFTKDRLNKTSESMYVMQFDEFAPGGGPFSRLSLIFTTQYRMVPGCITASEFGGYGWARISPNPYMLGLYDSKYDRRWNAWWQHYYTYNDPNYNFSTLKYKLGDTLKLSDNSMLTGDNYYKDANISCKKYWDWVKVPITNRSWSNVYMFRYPQVLLIAAEAYMRLGDNTNALFYINKIRANRILATSPNQLLTTINEDILLDEHARELAFEGQRWFLLKRVGKLVERVQMYGGISVFRTVPSPNVLYYACRTNIKPYHVRWPIPQAERDAMGGFPQNVGYAGYVAPAK
ncbi:MAG: RagB/SusD family nutrient uptake outer membrane protein [Bacteroidia bacterium]|nr:RagB/SusD family nutrient uptake outer membrane protein [Bacteroidia bacterium]